MAEGQHHSSSSGWIKQDPQITQSWHHRVPAKIYNTETSQHFCLSVCLVWVFCECTGSNTLFLVCCCTYIHVFCICVSKYISLNMCACLLCLSVLMCFYFCFFYVCSSAFVCVRGRGQEREWRESGVNSLIRWLPETSRGVERGGRGEEDRWWEEKEKGDDLEMSK